jgi:hypothetical protein
MKTITTLVGILLISISGQNAAAQFGNNGFGNNGRNQMGGMNQMGSMSQQPTEPEKPKEIPAEVIAAKYMENMKPAVGLDELQVIAISNVLVESIHSQGRITKLNLQDEALMNEYKALMETTDRKIINFLNKDQKEKYLTFKEQAQQPKKPKSKGKKKDKNPETQEK